MTTLYTQAFAVTCTIECSRSYHIGCTLLLRTFTFLSRFSFLISCDSRGTFGSMARLLFGISLVLACTSQHPKLPAQRLIDLGHAPEPWKLPEVEVQVTVSYSGMQGTNSLCHYWRLQNGCKFNFDIHLAKYSAAYQL